MKTDTNTDTVTNNTEVEYTFKVDKDNTFDYRRICRENHYFSDAILLQAGSGPSILLLSKRFLAKFDVVNNVRVGCEILHDSWGYDRDVFFNPKKGHLGISADSSNTPYRAAQLRDVAQTLIEVKRAKAFRPNNTIKVTVL